MKVSAVLVGVNVAATLSVAVQHPACAQDQHPASSTAAFLKSSLTEAAPAPISLSAAPQSLSPGIPKTSLSSARSVATRKALNQTPGVKLRPFVANRRLPSKSELTSASMASQVAEIDNGPQPTTLDGGVSEYSTYYMSENQDAQMSARAKYAVKQQAKKHNSERLQHAAKVASSFVRQVAPRAVSGASPAIPGSVGMPCAETNYNNMRNSVAMMPQQMQPQMQFSQPSAFQAPPEPPMQPPMQPPHLSPQEQLEMNKLVESACLQQGINPYAAPQPTTSLYQRVGPPPFPLSLIPEDTMKGFLKGARDRKSPIAGSNLAAASGGGGGVGMGGKQPLPAGGFHTYMAQTSNQGFGNYSRLPTAMPVSKHPVQTAAKGHAHHAPAKKVANTTAPNFSVRPETPKNQVLVYPPYRSQVNFGS